MNPTETKSYWVMLNQMTGHLAMWSCRQSPYHCPENLKVVIDKFREQQLAFFDKNEMAEMTRETIKAAYSTLKFIPEFRGWNDRKNGNKAPFKFVDRYSGKGNPDDDFIDLDALIGNCVRSLWKELETE